MSQYSSTPPTEPRGAYPSMRPHRGGGILALGIVGIAVCPICGIIAWVMGNADLREMASGRMDPTGQGTTQAGKICGMIATIIFASIAGIWLLFTIGSLILAGTAVTFAPGP